MAKILTYTMLMAGLLILLNFAGINIGGALFNYLGLNSAWGLGALAGAIGLMLIYWAGVGGSIQIGTFGRTTPESVVIAPIAGFLLLFSIGDMWLINQTITASCGVGSICAPLADIIFLVLGVLNAGYLIALISYWRGNDIM